MTLNLNPDFKEFLQLLNSHEVEYLVIGGYAVAAHGHPRYTKDIDIWVHATEDNAPRLIQTLNDFGFRSLGLAEADFLEPDTIVQLGYPPRRIDLLTSPSGVEFEECFPLRLVANVDGIQIPIIGLEQLRAKKEHLDAPKIWRISIIYVDRVNRAERPAETEGL